MTSFRPTCLVIAVVASVDRLPAAEIYEQQEQIVYAEIHGVGLLMDVFVPAGASNGLGIVDVVSGAWYSDAGKLEDHRRAQVFDILCGHGYTVFAVRPGSVTKFSAAEMRDNVHRGISWVRRHAADYDVDPERLGIMGASAGGHLASLSALTSAGGNERVAAGSGIAAVGAFFPPTDFLNFGGRPVDLRSPEGFGRIVRPLVALSGSADELSDEEAEKLLLGISPARLVTPGAPPFLLIHGDADPVVPLQQSQALLAALEEAGVPSELIVKPGGAHPWPTIHEEVEVLAAWFDEQLRGSGDSSHVVIDGEFDDWASLPSHTDPEDDTHDTDHEQRDDTPAYVDHSDVDLLEYKVSHDDGNLYFYFRSRGEIGRTQTSDSGEQAGRYYVIVTIDVDDNDETGYWVHEGGYYPTSRGYDVNAEIEFYDGQYNTGHYLNHGARNDQELHQAFLDQTAGEYVAGNDGPYPRGFMRVLPGTYEFYTQWVYHDDGTITIVRDKGPVVPGIVSYALSEDRHEIECAFPMKGFLTDENGEAIIEPGSVLDLSFSLEASGELAPGGEWASDTGEPINGYVVTPQ